MNCRHCARPLRQTFLDLGFAPPSNAYLDQSQLSTAEVYYPLKLRVCEACWLVQADIHASAQQLFANDYAYFSSVSQTWLTHASEYASMITTKLALTSASFVVEVASNDGYLLKNFVAMGIPCLGIEPTNSTADAAEQLGVPVLRTFFGTLLAKQLREAGRTADLVVGNNVYAHVPDIDDFTAGLKLVLKPRGTITLEFPHLHRMIERKQFDTAYHEHFSYLSATSVQSVLAAHGLQIFEIEQLSTHGGSLRVYVCHADDPRPRHPSVMEILHAESEFGLQKVDTYADFQGEAVRIKDELLGFLLEQKRKRKLVVAYGAAAKGNTLLNYAGIKPDLLPYVCDAAPSKQGKYLPGSHIPIASPALITELRPDFLLVLPWNILPEVAAQQSVIRSWGGRFVTAVPTLTVMP